MKVSDVLNVPFITGHIFLIEDEAWKSMRNKLTPTFSSGKMKMMFNTLVDVSDLMISQLKTDKNLEMIEMKNVLANFTTVCILRIYVKKTFNSRVLVDRM